MKLKTNKILYIMLSVVGVIAVLALFLKFSIYKANFNVGEFISYESKYLNFNENRKYIFMEPKNNSNVDTGIIFYPGGMVDEKAYMPLLSELSKEGYGVYIVKSIFKLPILNQNSAESIISEGQFDKYVLMGHSLGGTSLLRYLSKDTQLSSKIENVVLLASYGDGNYVFDDINVLSIIGSNDRVLNIEKYKNYKNNLPDNTKYAIINGGNHSYYGNYGHQRGDGEATISIEKQQYFVLNEIKKFLDGSK